MSQLPKGWVETSFKEVSDYIQRGKGPKYAEFSEYPVVNQKAVRWFGLQEEHLKYVHPEQWDKWDELRYIREGDILWNSTGTGTIGRACHIDQTQLSKAKVVDSHVTIVRTNKLVESKFAFYWVMHPEIQGNINGLYNGSTNQVELSKKIVESTRFPLAPLAEQTRIVEKLDEVLAQVDTIKARLDGIPAILKRFRQSVLAAAVSGKLTEEWRGDSEYDSERFPSSWSRKGLDDLGALARGKSKHRPRNDPRLFGNEYPFIQTGEVAQSNGVIECCTKWYSEFGLEQSRLFPKGTLCITIAANIADTAILAIDACFPDSVVGFIPNPEVTSALFVKYLIDVNKNRLEQFAPATAQKNINLKVLKSLSLPYPTIDEQNEIVNQVERYFAFADTIEAQVKKAQARVDKLTQSILAKAFRGELVPQDPNDEPADKLLERIAAARAEADALAKAAKKAGRKTAKA
ncbi:restriction endonuclease subunit S [Grimontia hollisae]|uniref:restriction endonuclease subunit S n=1 Tax=Grimontia hollisae TaxID=673 RepID=UPI0013030CBA|nr:restriction endonuclease subunit S [Grimontia hollisae]